MTKIFGIIDQIRKIENEENVFDIIKAWTKHPIGTVITRSDGTKWRKTAETGDKNKDWVQEKEDKQTGKEESQPKSKGGDVSLEEHAKNASETDLQATIKNSPDPELREAAHQELDRRKKEEHVQEEGDLDKGTEEVGKKENIFFNKTFKKYLDTNESIISDGNNNFMSDLSIEIGLENKVKLVNEEEYDKYDGIEIFRGTSKKEVDNIGKKDNHFSFSIFGSGVYFADSIERAYGGELLKSKIDKSANIVNYSDLLKQGMNEFVSMNESSDNKEEVLKAWDIYKDIGVYAMVKGVDIVHKKEEGYYLVINKSKLISFKKEDNSSNKKQFSVKDKVEIKKGDHTQWL